MRILPKTFAQFGLSINWAPNKTEAVLLLRGKGASNVRESYCHSDGVLAIKVAGTTNVLRMYKDLGCITEVGGGNVMYATARASTALAACCPIAVRVFGAANISLWLKLLFVKSLVNSTLTFNAHVSVLEPEAFSCLNAVYMRVLRRILWEILSKRLPSTIEMNDAVFGWLTAEKETAIRATPCINHSTRHYLQSCLHGTNTGRCCLGFCNCQMTLTAYLGVCQRCGTFCRRPIQSRGRNTWVTCPKNGAHLRKSCCTRTLFATI